MGKADTSTNGVRALVFLGLALVCGAAATVMIAGTISAWERRLEEARQEEPTTLVMVAAADLYPGVTITEEDVIGVRFPADEAPQWGMGAPQLVVGRVPQERILANEPIHPSRLADAANGEGLNVLVEPGMRALALDLANGAQLSGHLTPGSIVDVLVTIQPENGDATTTTVAQSVPVLAVNDRALGEEPHDKKAKKKVRQRARPSVTVMVTPEVAEQLAFAAQKGEMTLALRGNGDTSYATVSRVETPDLLPPLPPEPEKPIRKRTPPPPPPPTLQICEGTKCRDVVVPK